MFERAALVLSKIEKVEELDIWPGKRRKRGIQLLERGFSIKRHQPSSAGAGVGVKTPFFLFLTGAGLDRWETYISSS